MTWITILAVTVALAFLLLTLAPVWRARRAAGRPVPGLGAVLAEPQRRLPRLLVYFWSPRCGMCRGMTPVIDRLAGEFPGVIKVNIAETPDLAREFDVLATPSLAVVEHGVIRKLAVGTRSERDIRALLSS